MRMGHVMDDDFKNAVEHTAGDDVAQLPIQNGDWMPQPPQYFQKTEGRFYLNFHHVVDEGLIGGALRAADQQLTSVHMLIDVVHHPLGALRGFHTNMLRLFRLRQLREVLLGLHEAPHDGGGMGFHNGGEERLLAGKVTIKGTGGHSGVFDDLPQGGAEKALVQKFGDSRLLDFSA